MTEVTQCCDGVGFEMGQAIASTSDKVPRKSKNNEVGEKMFVMLGNFKKEMFGKKDEDKLASLRLQLHDAMEAARNAYVKFVFFLILSELNYNLIKSFSLPSVMINTMIC